MHKARKITRGNRNLETNGNIEMVRKCVGEIQKRECMFRWVRVAIQRRRISDAEGSFRRQNVGTTGGEGIDTNNRRLTNFGLRRVPNAGPKTLGVQNS